MLHLLLRWHLLLRRLTATVTVANFGSALVSAARPDYRVGLDPAVGVDPTVCVTTGWSQCVSHRTL